MCEVVQCREWMSRQSGKWQWKEEVAMGVGRGSEKWEEAVGSSSGKWQWQQEEAVAVESGSGKRK
jgi:hypothetical protein